MTTVKRKPDWGLHRAQEAWAARAARPRTETTKGAQGGLPPSRLADLGRSATPLGACEFSSLSSLSSREVSAEPTVQPQSSPVPGQSAQGPQAAYSACL